MLSSKVWSYHTTVELIWLWFLERLSHCLVVLTFLCQQSHTTLSSIILQLQQPKYTSPTLCIVAHFSLTLKSHWRLLQMHLPDQIKHWTWSRALTTNQQGYLFDQLPLCTPNRQPWSNSLQNSLRLNRSNSACKSGFHINKAACLINYRCALQTDSHDRVQWEIVFVWTAQRLLASRVYRNVGPVVWNGLHINSPMSSFLLYRFVITQRHSSRANISSNDCRGKSATGMLQFILMGYSCTTNWVIITYHAGKQCWQ